MAEKIWDIRERPPQSFFDTHPELPETVAYLLYHRGLRDQKAIDEFLNPDYSQDVHDPFLFKDMQKSVERIIRAIEEDEKIVVHGDYDADGVSASTILVSTIKAIGGHHIDVFLPHRETDGYGLNPSTIDYFADQEYNLIITCDCGVSNTVEIAYGNDKGMDTIVTDHHAIPPELPEAFSIIHPGVEDEPYPDKGLCGAGVAFKLAQALLTTHKNNGGTLPNKQTHEAFEKWLLDMVAIASVADMVPLLGESRTLTKYGLIVLNRTKRIGLQKLLLEAKLMQDDGSLKNELDADSIGFKIAPRINAAGRLDHANVAYELMMTKDPIEATDLAFQLDKNNRDRQKLTEKLVTEAIDQIEAGQEELPVLVVRGHGWQTGVVGLIASKLKEQYYKPALAIGINDGEATGSGRSIDGFNLIESMQEIPEHFAKYGGHPMACGFTLTSPEEIEPLQQALVHKFYEKTKDIDIRKKIHIDAELNLNDVTWNLYDVLNQFAPFGKDNEKPLYVANGVEIHSTKSMGKDGTHMRMMAKHGSPKIHKLVGWNLCGKTNKQNWCAILNPGDLVDIVFDIGINEWNGNRELQMTIRDLRKARA